MADALRKGYAATSTDTGHAGGAQPLMGHPEKVVDFGYRAVHEMAVKAKAIVNAFYGSGPQYSYWNGCSAGGRQGLQEAQRYPTDFDWCSTIRSRLREECLSSRCCSLARRRQLR